MQGLPFPDASFDFVYIRFMYAVIPATMWATVMQEIFRITRPGGWVESLESLPYAVKQRDGMATIINWFSDLLRHRGVDPLVALKISHLMQESGLMQITTREIGPTKNETQGLEEKRQKRESGLGLIETMHDPIIAAGITTLEIYEAAAEKARIELQATDKIGGFSTYVNTGQRP